LWEFFNLYSKTRIHCSQGKRWSPHLRL
jgi:hypothetical protein